MRNDYITHKDIANFADQHVNLKREHAKKYREQVKGLRDRLEEKLNEDPDFELRRMLLSGSLAKHTALKSINDIDVALLDAADAVDSALYAPTKGEAIRYWRKIFGTSFGG